MIDWSLVCQSYHQPASAPPPHEHTHTHTHTQPGVRMHQLCIIMHHCTSNHITMCHSALFYSTQLIFILRLDCNPFLPFILCHFLLTFNLTCPHPRSPSQFQSQSRIDVTRPHRSIHPPTPTECRTIFMVY